MSPPSTPSKGLDRRQAGILLHPTSLPGRTPVGDLGHGVDRFLDWAVDAGFGVWQVLPLTPPAAYASPYNSFSAFAGNPLLLSPDGLVDMGLLSTAEVQPPAPSTPAPDRVAPDRVDFQLAEAWKTPLLRRAWEAFRHDAGPEQRARLETFEQAPEQKGWLDDFALFRALKETFRQQGWLDWEPLLTRREPTALAQARREHADATAYHRFVQWLFAEQWQRVRAEVHRRGLRLLGDLPIYVAHDSAEVWAQPHLFDLDPDGRPSHVAGVPPDDLCADGQLWGNPLYNWSRMAIDGYTWWADRLAANLRQTDLVRLDHFRGFAGYWAVPAGAPTARDGSWLPGPGTALFDALERQLGPLPLVAEDLGVITDDVRALLAHLRLPCMRVLHFAFDEHGHSEHGPHQLDPATVLYTGTHDCNTTVGWYTDLDAEAQGRVQTFCGNQGVADVHEALTRVAYTSVAKLAVLPMQDVSGLGSEARMNVPGRAEDNWAWRARERNFDTASASRLRELARVTGRVEGVAVGKSSGG